MSEEEFAKGLEVLSDLRGLENLDSSLVEFLIKVYHNLENSLHLNSKESWLTPEMRAQAKYVIEQIKGGVAVELISIGQTNELQVHQPVLYG